MVVAHFDLCYPRGAYTVYLESQPVRLQVKTIMGFVLAAARPLSAINNIIFKISVKLFFP